MQCFMSLKDIVKLHYSFLEIFDRIWQCTLMFFYLFMYKVGRFSKMLLISRKLVSGMLTCIPLCSGILQSNRKWQRAKILFVQVCILNDFIYLFNV